MFSHRYSYLFAGLLGGYSFLNIYVLDGDRLYAVELDVLPLLIIILSLTFLVWGINQLVQNRVQKLFKQVHPLVVQLSFSILAVSGLAFFSAEITGIILQGPFSFSLQNFLLTLAFTSRINLFLNSINGIYFFQKKYKEKELEMERVKSLTSEAKLESINSQLNPHFFFNTLNNIYALTTVDVDRAQQALLKLSRMMRYVLYETDKDLTLLGKELDFIKDYIELMRLRLSEKVILDIVIQDNVEDLPIAPMLLLPFIENCFKHGISAQKESTIEISITQQNKLLHLQTRNTIVPANPNIEYSGFFSKTFNNLSPQFFVSNSKSS